jgi:hypothetical protein
MTTYANLLNVHLLSILSDSTYISQCKTYRDITFQFIDTIQTHSQLSIPEKTVLIIHLDQTLQLLHNIIKMHEWHQIVNIQ